MRQSTPAATTANLSPLKVLAHITKAKRMASFIKRMSLFTLDMTSESKGEVTSLFCILRVTQH